MLKLQHPERVQAHKLAAVLRGILLSLCPWFPHVSLAKPPTIFAQAAYQAPVEGAADDLLLLPGDGFAVGDRVVYRALANTTEPLAPPQALPENSTADAGTIPVVSTENTPYSLTVRLPILWQSGRSYAIWVRNQAGEWSNGVRLNDARPLWFTPAYTYASRSPAGLPRELKLVGRNLNPAPGVAAVLRMSGPEDLRIGARQDDEPSAVLQRYAPRFVLPAHLKPGRYRISFSRDGNSWLALADPLTVRPDPVPPREFAVSDAAYGGCRPDDGIDDTPCIARAITAAASAGGGTVVFPAGTWDLSDNSAVADADNGLVLPPAVNLTGAGAQSTRLIRHTQWYRQPNQALFTLIGRNTVRDLHFVDERKYQPDDPAYPTLRLGKLFFRIDPHDAREPKSVEDVTISHNVFDKVHPAIIGGGLPISKLFVTGNLFGAYDLAVDLAGNRYNMTYKFHIDDTVISGNTFKPGSYLDPRIQQGAMASQIGAARRLDFSDNFADGASPDFLYAPDDAKGWRAAYFWNMNDNLEMMLVSQNTATCTGDKIGDGEAISYDNNGNTFPFSRAQTVVAATADTVTVRSSLQQRQNERDVAPDYYDHHWVQIGEGRGLGQARKITGYTVDPATSNVRFSIAPAWDVLPQPGQTRISVGREYWQVYTLDNLIDQRRPLCQKSNRSEPRAGGIILWAQTADSVVAGNRQYDTDGIGFQQVYDAQDPTCPECRSETMFQTFLEIRGNTIDGEYDWGLDCSASGIWGANSAAPTPESPPLTASYGLTIAHNLVRHADGLFGGAISLPLYWYPGPPPSRWPVVDNPLIFHNQIEDVSSPPPTLKCGKNPYGSRIGINLAASELVQHAVLLGNNCTNVTTPLQQGRVRATKICLSDDVNPCECKGDGSSPE